MTRTESAVHFVLTPTSLKFAEQRVEMGGIAAGNVEIAAGHGARDEKGSGFDAVGNDAVLRAFQFAYAFHADGRRACAFDLCSHLVEKRGEVGDFGLAGAVLQNGFAFGESGGHEQVFGAGDGDFVEDNFRAFEAIGAGFDVAVILRDFRAELFESFNVHVDGTAPMAQPPGSETRARPQRATSGPRTSVEERMVLTSS